MRFLTIFGLFLLICFFEGALSGVSNIDDDGPGCYITQTSWRPSSECSVTFTRRRLADKYRGCYRDTEARMFGLKHNFENVCTVALCISFCRDLGFVYAGLQWNYECFCGNSFPKPDTFPQLPEDHCNRFCHGNRSQTCGGEFANSVYETGVEIFVIKADGSQAIVEDEAYWKK